MTLTRLASDARVRLQNIRRGEGENGFALVFVLAITMLITMLVATVTMVAASSIIPAQKSARGMAALAAAESGIQAFYAKLFTLPETCTLTTIQQGSGPCTGVGLNATSSAALTSADAVAFSSVDQARYTWKVVAVTGSVIRVQSTGTVGTSGDRTFSSKTLVADISGGRDRNFLNYAYYSTYETLASSQVQQQFGNRTITLGDPTVLSDAGVSGSPASVHWSGVPTTSNVGSQWCDSLYYTPAVDNSVNSANGGAGRAFQNSGLPVGYDFQEPTAADSAVAATHNGICQVDFVTGTRVNGPAYSRDAYRLSYGFNTGTTRGDGPQFDAPVYSAWAPSDTPQGSRPYNTFPVIGGDTKGGLNRPATASFTLSLPSTVSGALTGNTAALVCTYTGPTRVYVQGAYAYVTSPLTKADSTNPCYTSSETVLTGPTVPNTQVVGGGTLPGATGASVLAAKIPVASTLVYVKNANLNTSAVWNGQPIFSASAAAGSQLSSSTTTTTAAQDVGQSYNGGLLTSLLGLVQRPALADGAWTLEWTYACALLGAPCDGSSTNQAVFEKELGKTYVAFKKQVVNTDGTLKGATTGSLLTDLVTQLQSAFTADGVALSSGAPAAAPTSASAVSYYVTTNPATEPAGGNDPSCPATTTANDVSAPTLATNDPLFGQTSPGQSQTTYACSKKTVTATVYRQTAAQDQCIEFKGLLGACSKYSYKWVSPTKQFDVAPTRSSVTTTKSISVGGSVSFPLAADVTRYQSLQNGPGDAYVEGSLSGRLSVVAEHDTVVTGNLTYNSASYQDTSPSPKYSTSNAADLVAANNVRIYHPVGCKSATPAGTTPGYCPNDTTGLSPKNSLQFTAANFASHPSRQYVNLARNSGESGPLANVSVDAGVFALGGSLLADNYDRGQGYAPDGTLSSGGLNQLTLTGGVYQLHHGATGVQWETANSATSRPTSGYLLTIRWDSDLSNRSLPYVPKADNTVSTKTWTILSTSGGGS